VSFSLKTFLNRLLAIVMPRRRKRKRITVKYLL